MGVTEDDEGLYTWLADHVAYECGDNLAVDLLDPEKYKNMPGDLALEINSSIAVDPRKTRIYIACKDGDRVKGRHLSSGKENLLPGLVTQPLKTLSMTSK